MSEIIQGVVSGLGVTQNGSLEAESTKSVASIPNFTQEVVDGVIAAIKEEWPLVPVYDETVEQGLDEPSFSVRCVNPGNRALFRDRRYKQSHLIEVVYFPPKEGRYQSSYAVAETLTSILEIIKVGAGDLIRGKNMNPHLDDSRVLVFTVFYDYFAVKEAEAAAETMTGLNLEGVKVNNE